jgi:hypothetical protein
MGNAQLRGMRNWKPRSGPLLHADRQRALEGDVRDRIQVTGRTKPTSRIQEDV